MVPLCSMTWLTHPEITEMAAEKTLADAFYETMKDTALVNVTDAAR
jgi:hypothetical protein